MDHPRALGEVEATLGCRFTTVRAVGESSAYYAPLPSNPRSYELMRDVTARVEKHC